MDDRVRIAILGSTGSIGRSTLAVVERHPARFRVVALSARTSVEALSGQVERFRPRVAVVADDGVEHGGAGSGLESGATSWRSGPKALLELCERDDVDVVVNALVGAAGLEPTLRTLNEGKRLALANKESLVAGGPLVMEAAASGGGELVPVDSEHSAILQCLQGCDASEVRGVTLTASGGPFRGWDTDRLRSVQPSDALAHPTWTMGAKITVDSATLANKALEVIEAAFLYGLDYDKIRVVVHPQSIIHSFVEMVDGSVLAQLGFPTMELPILYALTHPDRIPDGALRTFDPVEAASLTFEAVDEEAFPLFRLGVDAGRAGGTAPAVYNAANEIAVDAFLSERIPFTRMAGVVSHALEVVGADPIDSLDDVLEADRGARRAATESVGTVPA